jgi:hypothetical protein
MLDRTNIPSFRVPLKGYDDSNDRLTPDQVALKDHCIVTAIQKTKVPKKTKKKLGFEYDADTLNDTDLCQKILQSNSYVPTHDKFIDQAQEIGRLLDLTEMEDRRNVGTIIGMTVLGLVGFFTFSFTIVGGVVGGVIGIGLGRYAGRKLIRRIKRKKILTQEEMYKIKLEVMIKWGELAMNELNLNINEYRLVLEKVIEEFAPALDTHVFAKPKPVKKIIWKLRKFLLRIMNQRTIILSYKLLIIYMKHCDLEDSRVQFEIANRIHMLFAPLKIIMDIVPNKQKNQCLVSYQNICRLLNSEYIQQIILKYPDVSKAPGHMNTFRDRLRENIDINRRITDFAQENKRLILSNLESDKDTRATRESHKLSQPELLTLGDIGPEDDYDEKATRKQLYLFECGKDKSAFSIKDGDKTFEEIVPKEEIKTNSEANNFIKHENVAIDIPQNKPDDGESSDGISDGDKDDHEQELAGYPALFHPEDTKSPLRVIEPPISPKKEESKVEEVFQKILKIDDDNYGKWEKVVDHKIMKIFKIKPEDSDVVLIRGTAFCEGLRPNQIFDVIYDSAYRQKWDTVVSNFQVVQKLDEFTDIIYFIIKTPPLTPVKNRDFVQVRRYKKDFPEPGHITISFQSTTHPSVPVQKNNVRGETIVSGYIIRPARKDPQNSSELVILSQVDIKGSIPKVIVNTVGAKAPFDWVNKMMKASRDRPIV